MGLVVRFNKQSFSYLLTPIIRYGNCDAQLLYRIFKLYFHKLSRRIPRSRTREKKAHINIRPQIWDQFRRFHVRLFPVLRIFNYGTTILSWNFWQLFIIWQGLTGGSLRTIEINCWAYVYMDLFIYYYYFSA